MDSISLKFTVLFIFFFLLKYSSANPRDFSIIYNINGYSSSDADLSISKDSVIDLFESWMDKHSKIYDSFADKLKRFEIFQDNLKHIDKHNKVKGRSYWLGLNEFADLSHEEFKERFLGLNNNMMRMREERDDEGFRYENVESLPKSVDWRKKGAVTYVKNQGQCGN